MAENSSKNADFALIKDNVGNAKVEMSGNMRNHVGDNYNYFYPPTTSAASRLQNSGNKEHSKNYAELCKVVNENTKNMTGVSVTEDFNNPKLNEPQFDDVYPQMRRVNNYFRRRTEDWEKRKILNTESRFGQQPDKKVLRNQTIREMGFHFQKKRDDEETVTFPELLKSFTREQKSDKVKPTTAIVASAGSGKTILMRRLAGKCVASTIARNKLNEENKQTDRNAGFKMVHYMEMRNMRYRGDTDVSTFLFDGLYKNKEDEKKAYEWLLEHQSEAILYFDGLDQATWSITTSKQEENQEKKKKKKKQEEDEEEKESRKSKNKSTNQRKLTGYQTANTAEIMYNLLSRSLLPQVKIVISSREFKVSELPPTARPDEIVSLSGFKQADAEKLFLCLVGDRGVELWGNIQTMARRLVNLLSIPVFLVLIAALTVIDKGKPPPVTITELYSRIMLNLSQVENIQERDQIHIVIKKLKAMAHQGMVDGRVVFNIDDLQEYQLSMQDVRDLMIKVPSCSGDKLGRYFVEGDYIFFFCHQSLQEFLSASFNVEMDDSDFSRFNEKHLHKSKWSVVCAFVSGILHEKSQEIPLEVFEEKGRIFRSRILSRCVEEERAVGLLAAIYESDNDDLIQSLPCLPDVAFTSLGPDEAHMFSSIWARRGKEKKEERVDLRFCSLNDELLNIMVSNLKDQKIRVGDLDIRNNLACTVKGLKPFLAMLKVDKIQIDIKRLKDFRYEDLYWNNMTKIQWCDSISMINKRERIEFVGSVNGYFYKTPRTFETDQRLHFLSCGKRPDVKFHLAYFFQEKVFQVDDQVYLEPSDLSKTKDLNLDWKVPKMLLDCRGKENVDSSLIELCVEKFQVSFLDIVVNGKTSFVPSNFLTEIESHIAIKVDVHWWFEINVHNDVTEFIPIVHQNQVENLRLSFSRLYSSFDDIKRVIENCRVKKLTLVYYNEDEKSKVQHNKIVKLGAQHSIEVDGVMLNDEYGTAWGKVDILFMYSKTRRRDVLHRRTLPFTNPKAFKI